MFTIIAVLATFLFLLNLWIRKKFQYWQDLGFVQGDPSFPMGTLSGVGTTITNGEKFDKFYKKFKGKAPVVGLYNFLSPILLPIDPELIKNIFVRNFQSFHDRGLYYNKRDEPVGANLLTLDGQEWRDRRTNLMGTFSNSKIKMMFPIVDVIGNKFVNIIEKATLESDDLEMRNWLQRFTTDNIANIAFGIEPNCLEDENTEFAYYSRKLVNINLFGIMKLIFGTEWPDIARKFGLGFAPKDVGKFFLKIFTDTFEYREKNKIERNDFISLLLGLKDVYTKEELAAEAFVIHFGGFETSSTLMTFVLYELALNQDIQERLREEITTGIEENDGKLTYDLLFGFKYLDMVVNETLRKYPPVPTTLRKCTKEYNIPDTDLTIPKGTAVFINAFSLHHDPEYFPEPEQFDPERFSDENVKNIKPYTYFPFGDGPRICIGARLGMLQSKMGITKLISNFSFKPCEKTSIPLKLTPSSPILAPAGGMWLKVDKV